MISITCSFLDCELEPLQLSVAMRHWIHRVFYCQHVAGLVEILLQDAYEKAFFVFHV